MLGFSIQVNAIALVPGSIRIWHWTTQIQRQFKATVATTPSVVAAALGLDIVRMHTQCYSTKTVSGRASRVLTCNLHNYFLSYFIKQKLGFKQIKYPFMY